MAVDLAELDGLDPFDLMDIESARLDAFFSSRGPDDWGKPTRARGWDVRAMLGHMSMIEEYNRACLDWTVTEMKGRAEAAGFEGMDAFNEWGIQVRADRSPDELIAQWRIDNADWRRRMRELGRDGTIDTSVGAYPSYPQAFYLAIEYATHGDDMGVEVRADEEPGRSAWRARFTRYSLKEQDKPAAIEWADGVNRIRLGDETVELTDFELSEAGVARLPKDRFSKEMRKALRCCA